MVDENSPYSSSNTWQAEQLRATAFILPDTLPPEYQSWWENVVGGKPDEERTRPQEGILQQIGTFEGKPLTLASRPGRIDWTLHARMDDQGESPQGFPVIGPFAATLELFRGVINRWLDVCPSTNRLAFGSTLLKPTANPQAGYKELLQYLPGVQMDFTNASDFLYQINRHRMSRSSETLRINRLTKWSVMESGAIGISLNPEGGAILPRGPRQFVCRIELDINTVPSRETIPNEKAKDLFSELIELGLEIADKGNIP